MARTQEERKAETRARLVAAAADLFARKGFHAVSAEAVADAADRTTGALYAHFDGKSGLLVAVLDEWVAASGAERVHARTAGAHDLDGRLRALWTGTGPPDAASGQRAGTGQGVGAGGDWALLEFELLLQAVRDPALADVVAERFASRRADFGQTLAAWADAEGLPRPAHPERTAGLVTALLMGLSLQHRLDPSMCTTDDVVAAVRALLLADRSADAPRRHDPVEVAP